MKSWKKFKAILERVEFLLELAAVMSVALHLSIYTGKSRLSLGLFYPADEVHFKSPSIKEKKLIPLSPSMCQDR